MLNKILLLIVLVSMISCKQESQTTTETNSTKVAKVTNSQSVEKLLASMTLEEKIGQMNQYNGFWDVTGPAPASGDAKMKYNHIKSGLVGSVLNVSGVKNVRALQEIVVNESRLGIPLIFGLDVIHGHKTLTPIPLAESASWDLAAIKESARIAAVEASARGINWTFAPMVDISRDARWGRVMEGAGEDPYLGSAIGVARVQGFQGDDLKDSQTLLATAKHFVGYGFAEAGRDYNAVDVGNATLYNVLLPPFKACIDAGVGTVMNSFNSLDGVPATGSAFLQRDILKDQWGFDGFVISDWGSIKEMIAHGFAKDDADAGIKAANAGSDMDMESHIYVHHLKKAVEDGKVDEKHINDAVRRILKAKEALGLFDDPYKYCDEEREKTLLYHKDHMDAALDMAKKSIVLLKNDNGLLPLKQNKSIAVIGTLAKDKTSPLGSWRIGSDDSTAISVLEGLDNNNIKYSYAEGVKLQVGPVSFINEMKINETDRSQFAQAIQTAKRADVVVMVLGEHGFQTGEGRSRTELDLPGLQQELLEEVYKVNKNIVLVLMNGRPLVLNWADKHIPAIVEAWQLGTQSGNAISEVLLGKYNPSGKLPMSFPRSVGQLPLYYNYLNTGRPGPSKLVFWSHYSDESNTPLYPFGYGLSYTNFKYDRLKVDNQYVSSGTVEVSVRLTNTGKVVGKEVVQLYIRDKVANVARPVRELKGFELVELAPSESKTITFKLTKDELGYFDNTGKFVLEPGEFDIFVGGDSYAPLTKKIEIE